ncbi:MAG: hypothetical protein RMK84_14740 [Oscillochloridaceae bacterium]|nr:hypothetical protein [Chloroflexaceae bacterium]MDW8391380.1 hypothetical protein [Oscillochloridaceae bacterium]
MQALDLADQNEGSRLEALYTVAPGLGLREGEAPGLHWRDISLEQHTLCVAQTVQRITGRLALEPPKTERSARLLPLPLFVERALMRHAERQALERRVAGDAWAVQTTIAIRLDAVAPPSASAPIRCRPPSLAT